MQEAGYVGKVKIGMDVAASEFFQDGKYNLDFKAKDPNPEHIKSGPELQEQYTNYTKQYPIISIEDPFDQDDFDSYANFTSEGVCQVCNSHFPLLAFPLSTCICKTCINDYQPTKNGKHVCCEFELSKMSLIGV